MMQRDHRSNIYLEWNSIGNVLANTLSIKLIIWKLFLAVMTLTPYSFEISNRSLVRLGTGELFLPNANETFDIYVRRLFCSFRPKNLT